MKNLLTKIALLSVLTLGLVSFSQSTVFAADCTSGGIGIKTGKECAQGDGVQKNLFSGSDSLFKMITNVLLFLIGAISVIMLIIGGFKYVVSNGDSAAVTSAKNTILYAVIGIVIALLAYAIVNFVVSSFIDNGSGGGGSGRQATE